MREATERQKACISGLLAQQTDDADYGYSMDTLTREQAGDWISLLKAASSPDTMIYRGFSIIDHKPEQQFVAITKAASVAVHEVIGAGKPGQTNVDCGIFPWTVEQVKMALDVILDEPDKLPEVLNKIGII